MSPKATEKVGPGIYRLSNGTYRVKVAVGDRKRGGLQRETTFPRDAGLRDMKGWQTQTRASLQRQGMRPAKGTVEADAVRYLERVQHRLEHPDDRKHEISAWYPRFGQRARHTITKQEVQQQVKDWLAAGVAASTVRHRLTALSSLYAELDGDEAFNPVRGVKRPKEPDPQPDFRPPEVILAVLDAMANRVAAQNRGWKTLARGMVLTYTGVRPSQMARLDVGTHVSPYLDDEVPKVFVPAGKGGKAHWKPLPPGGVAAFRLFERTGAQGRFSTSAFYKSWMLACDDANVARFNPYMLRHSYATLMRRGGADVADIQELLGHKSPKTTQRYAMTIPEKLVTATQQFQSVWSKGRSQTPIERPKRATK